MSGIAATDGPRCSSVALPEKGANREDSRVLGVKNNEFNSRFAADREFRFAHGAAPHRRRIVHVRKSQPALQLVGPIARAEHDRPARLSPLDANYVGAADLREKQRRRPDPCGHFRKRHQIGIFRDDCCGISKMAILQQDRMTPVEFLNAKRQRGKAPALFDQALFLQPHYGHSREGTDLE